MEAAHSLQPGTLFFAEQSTVTFGLRSREGWLYFLAAFFAFIPKESQVLLGVGTFNIGLIDLIAMACAIEVLAKNRMVVRFANRWDKQLILAFFACTLVSLLFARYPYFSIKGYVKLFEAVFLYFFCLDSGPRNHSALSGGMFLGAFFSLFLIDMESTDSKIYSAEYLLGSFYFLLTGLGESRISGKAFPKREATLCLVFFAMSFLVYPKMGSMLAFSGGVMLLIFFGYIRISLKTLGIILLLGLPGIVLLRSKLELLHQWENISTFVSGSGAGDIGSLSIRLLQFLVIPYIFKGFLILGYGYSQSPAGIDENLFNYFCNVSYDVFGFIPGPLVLHKGANYFSDNAYFTLVAELGFLILIIAVFMLRSLIHYFQTDKLLFTYIMYILIFSISIVDIMVYRGTGIFFLSPMLFAVLAGKVYGGPARVGVGRMAGGSAGFMNRPDQLCKVSPGPGIPPAAAGDLCWDRS